MRRQSFPLLPGSMGRKARVTSLSLSSQDCSMYHSRCYSASLSSAHSPTLLPRGSSFNTIYIRYYTFILCSSVPGTL